MVAAVAWFAVLPVAAAVAPAPGGAVDGVPACPEPGVQAAAVAGERWATWARAYGGRMGDQALDVVPAPDGGYAVAGWTQSFGAGGIDGWIVRVDEEGNVAWQRTLGGAGGEMFHALAATADGEFLLAGWTTSFGSQGVDGWLVKLNGDGSVAWQRTYGGARDDYFYSVQQSSDGGFVVGGSTASFDAAGMDAWLLKLDADGSVMWARRLGSGRDDTIREVSFAADGGIVVAGAWDELSGDLPGTYRASDAFVAKFSPDGRETWSRVIGEAGVERLLSAAYSLDGGAIVAGWTSSFGAGREDAWLAKLDENGSVEWERTYGGPWTDIGWAVQALPDGGFAVAGWSRSVSLGQDMDGWLMKVDARGNVVWVRSYGLARDDQLFAMRAAPDGGFVLAGLTESFGAGSNDAWVIKVDGRGGVGDCIPGHVGNTPFIASDSRMSSRAVPPGAVAATSASVSASTASAASSPGGISVPCSRSALTNRLVVPLLAGGP